MSNDREKLRESLTMVARTGGGRNGSNQMQSVEAAITGTVTPAMEWERVCDDVAFENKHVEPAPFFARPTDACE